MKILIFVLTTMMASERTGDISYSVMPVGSKEQCMQMGAQWLKSIDKAVPSYVKLSFTCTSIEVNNG